MNINSVSGQQPVPGGSEQYNDGNDLGNIEFQEGKTYYSDCQIIKANVARPLPEYLLNRGNQASSQADLLENNFCQYADQCRDLGILDGRGRYSQMLPTAVFLEAIRKFNSFDEGLKKSYIKLLQSYKQDPIATSTIFAIIAHGDEFAGLLIDGNNKSKLENSLKNSEKFFEAQQNFQQHYLSTCPIVSEFSILADLFHNNIFILNKIIEFELSKTKEKFSDVKEETLNEHAYNTINPLAPTIKEEVNNHITQCEKVIGDINNLELSDLKEEDLLKYQDDLVDAFERLAAIRDPASPVLLSQRFFQSFALSCIVSLILIFLAKIFTFGLYTGSVKYSERAHDFPESKNSLTPELSLSAQNPQSDWESVFSYGSAIITRNLYICDHSMAIKACMDAGGEKYFEIHDPLEKEVQKRYVEADTPTNMAPDNLA